MKTSEDKNNKNTVKIDINITNKNNKEIYEMFENSIKSFEPYIKNSNVKNHALRLFLMKSKNDYEADTRIDGREYPNAKGSLFNYAKNKWKNRDELMMNKKQYVIIKKL